MKNQEKKTGGIKKFLPLIIIGAVLVIAIGAFSTYAAIVLHNDTIYEGITIGDVPVGGMTVEEAGEALADRYGEALLKTVTISCEDAEAKIDLIATGARIDSAQTTELAFSKGRTGNLFTRLKEVHDIKANGLILPPTIYCDEAVLVEAVASVADGLGTAAREMELSIGEKELTITRGTPGLGIDRQKAVQAFKETVVTISGDVFELKMEQLNPKEPNAEDIYKEICGKPKDAEYKIENQRLIITEHKPGVKFDKEAAQAIIDSTEGETIIIPIETTLPEMTTEKLNESLFPDLLGSYKTNYNAGDTSRSYNVSLASQKINDIVLAPGDVFSYNGTVGPRTTARGFRTANVYVGNRVEPGVGGGICQVSTTLFNAVVYSDLKIVERSNHSLPVSYVPMGRDATVSYGSLDFKFANNTDKPIKIVASASGGVNSIAIYGTKANKARTIEIVTECIGTWGPKVVQTEDPNLPEGTVKVEKAGGYGSSYNAYKVIKENGVVVKREFLAKSTYVPSDRIEIIGTGPAEGEEPTEGEVTDPSVTEDPDGTSPSDEGDAPEDTGDTPIVVGPPNAQ